MAGVENLDFQELSGLPITEDKADMLVVGYKNIAGNPTMVTPIDNLATKAEVENAVANRATTQQLNTTTQQINLSLVGLSNQVGTKAEQSEVNELKDRIGNGGTPIERYKDAVDTIAILEALPVEQNEKGDGRIVNADVDANGQPYTWVWDGKGWGRTPYTTLPADVALKFNAFGGNISNSSSAPNHIDNIKDAGIYIKHPETSIASAYILVVRTIQGLITQERTYFSDAAKYTQSFRTYDSVTDSWSEWQNRYPVFEDNTYMLKGYIDTVDSSASNYIDNVKEEGIYSRSVTSRNPSVLYMVKNISGVTWQTQLYYSDAGKLVFRERKFDENTSMWSDWSTREFKYQDNTYELAGYVETSDTTASNHIDKVLSNGIYTRKLNNANPIIYWIKNRTNDVIQMQMYYNDGNFPSIGIRTYNKATKIWSAWKNQEVLTADTRNFDIVKNVIPNYLGQTSSPLGNDSLLQYKHGLSMMLGNYDNLIIVAGQSNADGRAARSEAPQWLVDMNYKIDNYMMWNRSTKRFESWELGVNTGSYNIARDEFGFDIFFAKKWLDENPNKKLYAIKQSEGGIPIDWHISETDKYACWSPEIDKIPNGKRSMCKELITQINEAFEYGRRNDIKLLPQCLLWHQGEADMANERRPYFEDNLKKLLGFMRGIFGAPALPIINGQVSSNYDTEWHPNDPTRANAVFERVNLLDNFFKTVDMSSQPTQSDNVHFTGVAYEYLGEGMYNYFKQFTYL